MLDTDSLATPIIPTTTVGIAQDPLSERSAIGAAAEPIAFPVKQYQVIYADPPWHYYGDPNKELRPPASTTT